jgi:hypothetical protein
MIWPLVLYFSLYAPATPPKAKYENLSPCSRLIVDRKAVIWISKSGVVYETEREPSARTPNSLRPLLSTLRQLSFRNQLLHDLPSLKKMDWKETTGHAYAEFPPTKGGHVIVAIDQLGFMKLKIASSAFPSDHRFYEEIVEILQASGAHALVRSYYDIEPPSPDDLPGLNIRRLDLNDPSTRAGVRRVLKFIK